MLHDLVLLVINHSSYRSFWSIVNSFIGDGMAQSEIADA